MKERYNYIRKRFNQIIKEKNNLKERRSRSFIEPNKNYIQQDSENTINECNMTKYSFYEENINEPNFILDKKFRK